MGVDPANLICDCGHKQSHHAPACMKLACSCNVFTLELREPIQPPQVEARRKTPEVVAREIRKFALDQAVKMMPYLRAGVTAEEVAADYEDYILNGKKADK